MTLLTQQEKKMDRDCKKCGHNCHCDKNNCPNCANDVCGDCDCESKEKN